MAPGTFAGVSEGKLPEECSILALSVPVISEGWGDL